MRPEFILASNSPRRRELLAMLGMDFSVIVSDCDESINTPMAPDAMVRELALRKANAVAERQDTARDFIVIGADTIVWDGTHILGKPHDREDARRAISLLAGREHSVFTGIALIGCDNGQLKTVTDAVESKVVFDDISPEEIEHYVASGEPMDKAGSYAIQSLGGVFVKELHGDYFNIVGLPIARMRTLLREEFGLSVCDYAMRV
ncbi:MAG: septum formation inhibitor Maf [Ruminococcaceae bacterium]|nr:septum formation inhibitor Maf [Oscillospiraceae bacterium]